MEDGSIKPCEILFDKIGDVYDPELDLSSYKYPKVDLLNDSKNEKIQIIKTSNISSNI